MCRHILESAAHQTRSRSCRVFPDNLWRISAGIRLADTGKRRSSASGGTQPGASSSLCERERPVDHSKAFPMPAYRFGKNPPKHDYRTLRLKKYLGAALPPPPQSYNVLATVFDKLHTTDAPALFPMDGNDTLGDCTIAGVAHAITTYRGLIGKRNVMAKEAVTKLYLHLSGGVDSGLYELDVLNYWRKNAVSGDKILAYATVDVKN